MALVSSGFNLAFLGCISVNSGKVYSFTENTVVLRA